MTGRYPIRSALSVVVVSGRPQWPDEFHFNDCQVLPENGYSTYFSGKWHLGDQ
jgi:arylsulfatase A-like enzyme